MGKEVLVVEILYPILSLNRMLFIDMTTEANNIKILSTERTQKLWPRLLFTIILLSYVIDICKTHQKSLNKKVEKSYICILHTYFIFCATINSTYILNNITNEEKNQKCNRKFFHAFQVEKPIH